jgi:hypothetical protein
MTQTLKVKLVSAFCSFGVAIHVDSVLTVVAVVVAVVAN